MQKLLLKKGPFEPEVRFEDFVFEEKNPLKEALSKLFGSLVMAKLEQEDREMEIEIDEEKKMIKFKIKRTKRKMSLEKIGNTYKLRKELESNVLTLVYNLPVRETTQTFEKPEIMDRQKMYAKLFSAKATQSKQIVDNTPIKEKATLQIKTTEIPTKIDTYEEKFKPLMNDGDGYVIKIPYGESRESIHYENPQKFLENQLTQLQLPKTQESGQLLVYRTIVLENTRTGEIVLDCLLRAGHRITYIYDRRYGVLITSVDGIPNGYNGGGWEFYVNGKLADVGVDSYVLKKGDTITWKFMKGGPCSPANN